MIEGATGSVTGSWRTMGWCIAIVSALLLCFATPSRAALGVDSYWGSIKSDSGQESTGSRFQSSGPRGVAVNEATGDVYVADSGFNRVQQFDDDGNFIRAWGFDVNAPESIPQTSASFEICTVKSQCKSGAIAVATANGGQVSNPSGIAVDQGNGHVYLANAGMFRVEEFTSSGSFVRAFGLDVVASGPDQADEEQTLTVNAAAGQYKLKFGGAETADVEWNEPAAGIEAQLNALAPVNAGGGSVAVSGGPGSAGGATPYLIRFAGARADTNQATIEVKPGSVALSGGSGTGSNAAAIVTVNEGAVGYEICNSAASCKSGTTNGATGGALAAASLNSANLAGPSLSIVPGDGTAPNAGNLLVAEPVNKRVQEFSPTGQFVRAFGWEVVASGPDNKEFGLGQPDQANEIQKVIVKATEGKFQLTFGSGGAGVSETAELNATASAPEVEDALNDITNISAGGGSVAVSGGRGDATGSTPYVVTFNGGPRGGTNVAQMNFKNISLTGGVAASAIFVYTDANGAQGFEVCRPGRDVCKGGSEGSGKGQFGGTNALRSVAADTSGTIYTVEPFGTSTPESNLPRYRTSGLRVQTFTLPGNVPTPQGAWLCEILCGSNSGNSKDNPVNVATDGQGMVYVAKAFLNGDGDPLVEQPSIGGNPNRKWQERILKIDPAGDGGLGQVVETVNANTGAEPGIEGDTAAFGLTIEGVSALASTTSGKPLYVATSGALGEGGRSRIYRFNEISGPSGSVSTGTVGATAVTLEATITPAPTVGPVKTYYRFEYRRDGTTDWTPSAELNIGNGSGGGESDVCSSQMEAAICHVSGEIDGLELGRSYEYRLVARTSYQGSVFATAPQEFTTEAVAPSVATGGAIWSGPPSSDPTVPDPSLTFNGRVNPQGGNTTYAFQYVRQSDFETSGFAKAQIAPVAPISAGHGAKTLDVVIARNDLDPLSGYWFRLVASSAAGSNTGTQNFVPASHVGDRFVELVTEGDSQGADVAAVPTVSDDGERVAFTALAFGKDQQAAPWIVNPAIAQRGNGGWMARAMAGDPARHGGDIGFDTEGGFGNADVTQRLWPIAPEPQTVQLSVRTLDGSLAPISPVLSPLDRAGNFSLTFRGGSTDLSTMVFSGGNSTLFPGEPLLQNGAANLYKVSEAGTANASVSWVNRDGGGVIGGACGASLGSAGSGPRTNAVSADGSVVYFSARAGTPASGSCTSAFPMRIFKRVEEAGAVEVSACAKTSPGTCPGGDDQFWGASADGSRVFFSTSRQLIDTDTDSTADLYVYDESLPAAERLIQASAGEIVAGDHPAAGAGAEVLGVADTSMDGSRVYFVAKGRLVADAVAGANNLYVFERDDLYPAGRIQLVARLAPGTWAFGSEADPRLWAPEADGTGGYKPAYALPRYEDQAGTRVNGDGHLFLFVSAQPLLPGEDQDTVDDLYRYDDSMPSAERLVCLSCAGDGAQPVNIIGRRINSALPDRIQRERVAGEGGSEVVFRSSEQLSPADTNTAEDVYLWDDGALSLVSGATAEIGTSYAEEGGGPALSPDGKTVFFATRATLLPQDLDSGARDIYAARINGGFRQEDVAIACSNEEACRGSGPVVPVVLPGPGTSSFAGSGNVKECGKRKVLRKGRCVKKRLKKQKHSSHKHRSGKGKKQSRAGSGRRVER